MATPSSVSPAPVRICGVSTSPITDHPTIMDTTGLAFWLVQRREAGRVTPYLLATPVVSMIVGWSVMGDVLTPQILTGAGLTLLGVAIVALAERGLRAGVAPGAKVKLPT